MKERHPSYFERFPVRRVSKIVGGLAVVSLALAACVGGPRQSAPRPELSATAEVEVSEASLDLLSRGIWNHAGMTSTPDGLRVDHVGMAIVEQDGSDPSANPPLNLYGTHLAVQGDFEIAADITHRNGEAALTLYGRPPIILDEVRVEPPSVRIALEENLWVGVWDGSGNTLVQEALFDDFVTTPDSDVRVRRVDNTLQFFVDDQLVGEVSDHGIFAGGQVWLGWDAGSPDGGFVIDGFSATGIGDGVVEAVDTRSIEPAARPSDGFRSLIQARRGAMQIGAAVSLEQLVSDPRYYEIAAGTYGSWTTENALKMQFVQPARGRYEFGAADAIFALADKNEVRMHLHTLVFGEANPTWVQELAQSDPSALRDVMLDHVQTVMAHYKGRVQSVDVVNEPLADYDAFIRGEQELRNHVWHRSMGESYIDLAFRRAHEIDPAAKLFINEYGLEGSIGDGGDTERWDAFLALVDRLLARGVPVHGVGFQTHVYEPGDEIDPVVFQTRIDALRQRGLIFRISEADVHTEAGRDAQAAEFGLAAQICRDNEDICMGMTTWGVTEATGSTGYIDDNGHFVPGEGLMYDVTGQPLPAVAAVRDILK